MKRKRIVKVPTPEGMSIADALVVCQQTITVTMVMLRGIDPNEAYDEWQLALEPMLAVAQTLGSILDQYGEQINILDFQVPRGVGLGGYRVDDLDAFGKKDDLPF